MSVPTPIMYAPLEEDLSIPIGSGSPSYLRTGTATYIKDGLINYASDNVPRFEDDGLLVEGQATNFVRYSSDLDDPLWVPSSGAVVTPGQGVSPDGITLADRVDFPLGQTSSQIRQSFTGAPAAGTYTFSCWVKQVSGGSDQWRVRVNDSSGNYTITFPFGTSEWVRREFTFTATNNLVSLDIRTQGSSDAAFLFWGVQVELMGFATTYIPTTTTTASRGEDRLSYDADNWPDVDTDFSVAFDIKDRRTDGAASTVLSIAGLAGGGDVGVNTGNLSEFNYGGVTSTALVPSTLDGLFRSLAVWDAGGDQLLYSDGAQSSITSPVSSSGGAVSSLLVGRKANLTNNFFGNIRNLRIYDSALTSDEAADEGGPLDLPPPVLTTPYSIGTNNGPLFTIKTSDTLATIEGVGFFDGNAAYASLLKTGDVVLIEASNGTKLYNVTVEKISRTITLSAGTEIL